MGRNLEVPPALTAGPFTRATALLHVSDRQLRHPAYRRLSPGLYIVTERLTHGDKIRAARLVLPESAVLTGRSAMWVHGVRLADPDDPVEVYVPPDQRVRRRDLLRVRHVSLPDAEVAFTRWGRATTPARTAYDLARIEDPLVSVPLLDALIRETGVRRREVEVIMRAHAARRVPHVARALDLVDTGAESVRESKLRTLLVLAGLPRPRTQVRIFNSRGEFVGRVDLGWVELMIAVEYDGAHHDDPTQIARDRARLNALRLAGWTVIVVDRKQLARPDDVVAMIRAVLAAGEASRPRPAR